MECVVLVLGIVEGVEELGKYGVLKVYYVIDMVLDIFDSQVYIKVIVVVVEKVGVNVVIVGYIFMGKLLFGCLVVCMNVGFVFVVNVIFIVEGGIFKVCKFVFFGKVFVDYEVKLENKVFFFMGNFLQLQEVGEFVSVEVLDVEVLVVQVMVKEVKCMEGCMLLLEVELVVFVGCGMKGLENWGIIEELVEMMGVIIVCFCLVVDVDWCFYYEYVGQIGVVIWLNFYFVIGIFGVIQYFVGVNSFKIIVVINKDLEVLFFKVVDYGVVGDLFDVVFWLNEVMKKFKVEN